jgi:nucleoid-associated protein EbfC
VEPGFDMNQILQAAQQMQAQLESAQRSLAEAEVTGTAGGGLVVAKISGQGELLDLTIDPKVIDVSDPAESAETIADMVLAAVRDATNSVMALQQQQLGFADALNNIDLSGLGLPGGLGGGMPGMPGIPGIPGMPGVPGVSGLPGFGAPGTAFGHVEDDFDEDEDEDEDEDDEGWEEDDDDEGDDEEDGEE